VLAGVVLLAGAGSLTAWAAHRDDPKAEVKGAKVDKKKLAEEQRTMVFYESPLRLLKTLQEFILYFGAGRKCCVCRELTKLYEENIRGTLQEVSDHFLEKGVKGEIVIVLEGTG